MKYLIFFFCGLFCYSQENTIVVDYTYSTKFKSLPSATTVNSRLISDGVSSTFEMDFLGELNFYDEQSGVEDNNNIYSIKARKNPIIYKDNKSGYIYSVERVLMKPFLVKDSMNIFNWKLHPEKQQILEYECQKATTYYRGRNYTAYFTTDIPFQTGPWKFYGLPGLILKVESDDGLLKINVNRFSLKNKNTLISNPFKENEDKAVSWNDYRTAYQKKYQEMSSYSSPNGGKILMPRKLIEELVVIEKEDRNKSNYEFKINN